jgi:signal transduction histidine kinase/ligand-binding sensor domain-containing protein
MLSIAVLLFPLLHLCAQTFPMQAYTTRDGLPSDNITALFQDSRGFLWIGTDNGLSVFNGATFRNTGMADGLPNSYVTSILESRVSPGTFWVGTIAGGLVQIAGNSFRTYRAGRNNVGTICEDSAGRVWCVISDSLYVLSGDSLRCFPAIPPAEDIALLAEGTLVVKHARTLSLLRQHARTPTTLTPPLRTGEAIAAMMIDAGGTIVLALTSGSIMWLAADGSMKHRSDAGFAVSPNLPSHLASDRSGRIWLTTPSALLSIAPTPAGGTAPPTRRIAGVFAPLLVDREDILWTGGPRSGLLKLTERRLQRIPIDGLQNGFYNQVACMDSSGHIWMTTTRGLAEAYRIAPGEWVSHEHAPVGSSRHFGQLVIDPRGRLWTNLYGSARYVSYTITPGTGGPSLLTRSDELEPALFSGDAPGFTFTVDRRQRAWCTTLTEVVLVNISTRTVLKRFGPESGLPGDSPRALLFDSNDHFWSGSWSTGLSLLRKDGGEFETFTNFAGIPGVGVRSLLEDAEGAIWIGTRYGGVARYQDGVFQTVTVRDGLLSNAVWSLAETPNRIWLGTDVGLQSLDKRTLRPSPPEHGLLVGRVYATGAYGDHFVWCVTAQDVIVFESPEDPPGAHPPPTHITSFAVNGAQHDVRIAHEFPHDQNTCVFEFVGISFRDERAVTYQYRMLGVDSAWSDPHPQRSVIFAALTPGAYRFEVRALSAAGSASNQPAVVSFVIIPPYWQRWWFAALLLSALTALILLLYRYRVARVLEMERLRTRIAADLHDDVGTNLSSIMLASQIIERELPPLSEQRRQLWELRTRAGMTQDMLKDIVWLLDPRNDTFEDFILKLKDLAHRQLMNIPCSFTVSGEHRVDRLRLEFKRTIVLFFKEAMTNIAKHAGATAVQVDLALSDDLFSLSIRDNGRGFDPAKTTGGNGLRNLRARASHLGGTVDILSAPGAGTTIRLTSRITYTRSGRNPGKAVS